MGVYICGSCPRFHFATGEELFDHIRQHHVGTYYAYTLTCEHCELELVEVTAIKEYGLANQAAATASRKKCQTEPDSILSVTLCTQLSLATMNKGTFVGQSTYTAPNIEEEMQRKCMVGYLQEWQAPWELW